MAVFRIGDHWQRRAIRRSSRVRLKILSHFLFLVGWIAFFLTLERAIKANPGHVNGLFNLSIVYEKKGELEIAEKTIVKALTIMADDPYFRYQYGSILLAQEKLEPAERELLYVVEKEPEHADALYNLGLIAQKTFRPPVARKYYQQSLKFSPNKA